MKVTIDLDPHAADQVRSLCSIAEVAPERVIAWAIADYLRLPVGGRTQDAPQERRQPTAA